MSCTLCNYKSLLGVTRIAKGEPRSQANFRVLPGLAKHVTCTKHVKACQAIATSIWVDLMATAAVSWLCHIQIST